MQYLDDSANADSLTSNDLKTVLEELKTALTSEVVETTKSSQITQK